MDLTLTTPALLFPAISLLLLAYTNRFLTLATLIRNLRDRYASTHEAHLRVQIDNFGWTDPHAYLGVGRTLAFTVIPFGMLGAVKQVLWR